VWFEGATPTGVGKTFPVQEVTEDAGNATVTLSRSNTAGSLRVKVTTDPTSPYVGVNVGAVDQTVTFADGQSQATLTVPILAGARNPGEVDVPLYIKPIDPATIVSYNLDLRVKPAPSTLPPTTLQFASATTAQYYPVQVVTQQAGEAAITLSRSDSVGRLRVEVTTDPTSPFVGVNVGAVDQTVTFADGQSQAALTVPILAGAPNPGAVDVYLTAKIVDPAPAVAPLPSVLDLKIVQSDSALPPKVVSIMATSHGIVLTFNKPMNPVGASNVANYAVYVADDTHIPGPLGTLLGKRHSLSVTSWSLKSAEYDPATQTVTLIPNRPNPNIGILTSVTQLNRVRTSVRPRQQSHGGQALTDTQGNPINAHTSPGKVGIRLLIPEIL
jgi:hypothetical protein